MVDGEREGHAVLKSVVDFVISNGRFGFLCNESLLSRTAFLFPVLVQYVVPYPLLRYDLFWRNGDLGIPGCSHCIAVVIDISILGASGRAAKQSPWLCQTPNDVLALSRVGVIRRCRSLRTLDGTSLYMTWKSSQESLEGESPFHATRASKWT